MSPRGIAQHKWSHVVLFSSVLTLFLLTEYGLTVNALHAITRPTFSRSAESPSSDLLQTAPKLVDEVQGLGQQALVDGSTAEVSRTGGVGSPRALGLLTITAILAVPLILLFVILLFLPIPVAISTARMAKEIVTSDECLERVACEALRFTRAIDYDAKWIQKILRHTKQNSIWIERASRGVHTQECGVLSCDPIMAFSRAIR